MNSKERLMAVLSGRLPDRVPISTYELCGYNSVSFENQEPSYRRLMDFIRCNTDALTMWNPPGTERQVKSSFTAPRDEECWDEGKYHVRRTILHASGRNLTNVSKYCDSIKTIWNVEHFCKDIEDVDALMNLPYEPVTYSRGDYERVTTELGNHGIIMASLSDPVCTAMEIMEFGEATVWALTEPDHFKKTLNELQRRNMQNLRNMLEVCPVDLYRICGPEYVTPPYLAPEHFENYVYPYLCEMVELIHSYGKKVRIHSHGRIGRVLDMILDTGADALDPCEAPPDGDVDLAAVKKKAAGRAAVFGNLQLKLLENAKEAEVRQEVRRCMEAAKEGGGYVVMPTASPINIPLSAKTECNYFAFIEEALILGRY